MAIEQKTKSPIEELLCMMRKHRASVAAQGKEVEQRNARIDAAARPLHQQAQARAREITEETIARREAPAQGLSR